MKDIVIAIDGYSGTGKSSTAKAVAAKLNYTYCDSGAMYRAVTLFFLQNSINFADAKQVEDTLQRIQIDFRINPKTNQNETVLNGKVVEDQIRKLDVSNRVSEISAISDVRKAMVDYQRRIAKRKKIVMDGRDIGTVVLPDAELKVFMVADLAVRAKRRLKDLEAISDNASISQIMANLQERDQKDTSRAHSPLKKAHDAIVIDTTNLLFEQQVDKIVNYAERIMNEKEIK